MRVHASSGTTGKPTVVAYTRGDIDLWAEMMARTLAMGGVTDDDVVHNAYGYGLFTGGLGIHYGAERLGATVIPVSGGNTKRQIMLMQDLGSTRPLLHALLRPLPGRDGAGDGRRPARARACGSASSAPSPGRTGCARRSRPSWASWPSTSTA